MLADIDRLSAEAFRTLAVAYRPLEQTTAPHVDESIERGLIYAGMVGIIDPPRPEAAEAIRQAHRLAALRQPVAVGGDRAVVLLQLAAVHLPVFNTAFGTTPLTVPQWLVCTAMASAVLWAGELRKLAGRLLARR